MEFIPKKYISSKMEDLPVSFMLHGGNAATRTTLWQCIHVFGQHIATTPMPPNIAYPGLVDPGVNVALPICYASYQGFVNLLSCISVHPSGSPARGAETTLDITTQGQPTFSITV